MHATIFISQDRFQGALKIFRKLNYLKRICYKDGIMNYDPGIIKNKFIYLFIYLFIWRKSKGTFKSDGKRGDKIKASHRVLNYI